MKKTAGNQRVNCFLRYSSSGKHHKKMHVVEKKRLTSYESRHTFSLSNRYSITAKGSRPRHKRRTTTAHQRPPVANSSAIASNARRGRIGTGSNVGYDRLATVRPGDPRIAT